MRETWASSLLGINLGIQYHILSIYSLTSILTHKASHGVLITILDGKCPYFVYFLHDFVMDWMVFLKPLQYIAAFIVSLRWAARGAEDGGDTT